MLVLCYADLCAQQQIALTCPTEVLQLRLNSGSGVIRVNAPVHDQQRGSDKSQLHTSKGSLTICRPHNAAAN